MNRLRLDVIIRFFISIINNTIEIGNIITAEP